MLLSQTSRLSKTGPIIVGPETMEEIWVNCCILRDAPCDREEHQYLIKEN